jgi:uncharacterized membrane protein HdeD (DUF308 family)
MSDKSATEKTLSTIEEERRRIFEKAKAEIAAHRNWFIALGILLIVLGILAIAFPLISTITAKIFLGWLFLIGGISQIIHAFSTKTWSQFLLNILIGLLYLLAGGWLAFFPLTGIITLTLFLAAMFIVEGVLEGAMAFRIRPHEGWVWMLVAGIIAILCGVLIVAQLPSSALWAIGLLAGINIISTGWAYLFLALRSAPETKTAAAAA